MEKGNHLDSDEDDEIEKELAELEAEFGISTEKPKEEKYDKESIENVPAPLAIPLSKVQFNDIYSEYAEKEYHDTSKIFSLSSLEKEKEVCEHIIQYKEKNRIYNTAIWKNKKESINANSRKIKGQIENGEIEIKEYLKIITEQKKNEESLLKKVEVDTKLQVYEVPIIKERIMNRLKEIEVELTDLNKMLKEKKIEQLLNRAEERLKEYNKVKQYFENNKIIGKEVAMSKIKTLNMIISKIKKEEEVDESEFPEEVTPEYICRCLKEEREAKYKYILNELMKQKNEIKMKLSKIKERNGNDTQLQSEFIKCDELIHIITKDADNQWVPPPLYYNEMKKVQVEKENENIPENTVIIKIGKVNYNKSDVSLAFTLNTDTKKKEEIKNNNLSQNEHTIKWIIDKKEYAELHNKNIQIEVFNKNK